MISTNWCLFRFYLNYEKHLAHLWYNNIFAQLKLTNNEKNTRNH